MFGREELDKLNVQKQALLLEISLNRLALRAELRNLCSAAAWTSEATRASRRFAPVLLLLAPLAGFLLGRRGQGTGSWFGRLSAAIQWIAPLYRFWKAFAPGRKQPSAKEPAD